MIQSIVSRYLVLIIFIEADKLLYSVLSSLHNFTRSYANWNSARKILEIKINT